jgi:phage baseplate assembly protein W
MRDYPDVPKLSLPFRFHHQGVGTGLVAHVAEQDSLEEIVSCVEAVIRTVQGTRIEEPEFGLPDLAFSLGHIDPTIIEEAAARWEPRARVDVPADSRSPQEACQHVHVEVRGAEVLGGRGQDPYA